MQPKLTNTNIFNLLGNFCDSLVSYKVQEPQNVKVTLELPESTFNRIVSELKDKSKSIDETDFAYGGFKFCVKKTS